MFKNNRKIIIISFIIASIIIPLFYCLYTNNIWEDFFITLRYSKNLIYGKGLVYNAGERVYGFTSPLETMVLSFCYLITGKNSYLSSIWLFRIISILAFSGGGVLLLFSLPKKEPTRIFLAALYLFEAKSVLFSVNGMETALMLFFLAWFVWLNSKNCARNWIAGGICWSGLLFTRPDSVIYISALSLAILVFNEQPRKETLLTIFKMAFVFTILYLPWLIWTWGYYGSPIPNTILAKVHLIWQRGFFSVYQCVFGPVYIYLGSWPKWIAIFSFCLVILSALYWVIPSKDRQGRMISFACFFIYIYLLFIPRYPWYYPPIAMLSLFVLAKGLATILDTNKIIFSQIMMLIFLVCVTMIYIFVMTAVQMRIAQKEIEDGNRKLVGLWIRRNCQSEESVYLEPLGYIGYFSEAKIIDYPGLVSPKVVKLLNKNKDLDFWTLVLEINPDWIILRPYESEKMYNLDYFKNNYAHVKTFSAVDSLKKYHFIPGAEYLSYDATFLIFKRK